MPERPITPVIVRFGIYTLIITAFTAFLPYLKDVGGYIPLFDENGPIENVQLTFLICTSLIFVYRSLTAPIFRELSIILACVGALAAIRELDEVLDKLIPVIGWQLGYVVLLYAIFVGIKNRTKLVPQLRSFLYSRGFAVLWGGFIVAIPVAQLLGHGPFLEALLDDEYNRNYKRVIEESGEVVGYFLLLAGSIETFIYMKYAQEGEDSSGSSDACRRTNT